MGSISVLGDFAETNDCGLSVAASSTCQIEVTFTPTVAGNRTGTLTVVYTAAGSPQAISLSGAGVGTGPALGLGITSGGSSSATVGAGQAASYAFSIGGAGMSGTASLSCTGTPTGATCSLPTSEPFSSTVPVTFSVKVTTTSRTIGALHLPASTPLPWLWTIAVLGIVVWPGMSVPKRSVRRFLSLVPLTFLFFLVSCGGGHTTSGGGGGGPQPNPNGTPAGTYALTVKATSGSATETSSLTLIVQ